MANNPERDCSTCKYGNDGSNHESCPETCLEPEVSDYDPIPTPSINSAEEELVARIMELEVENEGLSQIFSTLELRIHFALQALPPRPPFRINSIDSSNTVPKDLKDNNTKAEPLGEAPFTNSLDSLDSLDSLKLAATNLCIAIRENRITGIVNLEGSGVDTEDRVAWVDIQDEISELERALGIQDS